VFEGQVVESGAPDIIENPKTDRMKKFLGQIL
jgi:ABC-type histidine transport system ATPase subunit